MKRLYNGHVFLGYRIDCSDIESNYTDGDNHPVLHITLNMIRCPIHLGTRNFLDFIMFDKRTDGRTSPLIETRQKLYSATYFMVRAPIPIYQ